jgi:hypothetical protein
MGIRLRTVIWTFIWCLFMQVFVGTIFVMAIPAMDYVAQPFTCSGGAFQQVVDNDPSTGQATPLTILNWYCVDQNTGSRTKVSDVTVLEIADGFYGVLFFLFLFLAMVLLVRNERFMVWWREHSGRAIHYRY